MANAHCRRLDYLDQSDCWHWGAPDTVYSNLCHVDAQWLIYWKGEYPTGQACQMLRRCTPSTGRALGRPCLPLSMCHHRPTYKMFRRQAWSDFRFLQFFLVDNVGYGRLIESSLILTMTPTANQRDNIRQCRALKFKPTQRKRPSSWLRKTARKSWTFSLFGLSTLDHQPQPRHLWQVENLNQWMVWQRQTCQWRATLPPHLSLVTPWTTLNYRLLNFTNGANADN